MTKKAMMMATLLVMSFVAAGLALAPTASAAECSGSIAGGQATFRCTTNHGACGAAVYHGGGGTGGGCVAGDY